MEIKDFIYKSPYFCYVNLTEKCNLRCIHCFGNYDLANKNELSLKQWKKVINELIALKVFYINISGGEPTQHLYFKDIIKFLNEKGMHFILTTNGVFSKKMRDFIVKNQTYLIGIKISLDGPDIESHEFIRRSMGNKKGKIFNITLRNIKYFKKQGIPLTIASILHKKNIRKLGKFSKLIKKINPISWFISPIIPIGRADIFRNLFHCRNYFNLNFWNNIKNNNNNKNGINVNLIDMPLEKNKLTAYECAAGLNFCEIHSDGTVSPCTLARICIKPEQIFFENIKNKSLKEIWNGEAFLKFRDYMNTGCKGCKMLSKCNKCIAQSFRYFNNGSSPTPFCIKDGKKLGLKFLEEYKKTLNEEFGIK